MYVCVCVLMRCMYVYIKGFFFNFFFLKKALQEAILTQEHKFGFEFKTLLVKLPSCFSKKYNVRFL